MPSKEMEIDELIKNADKMVRQVNEQIRLELLNDSPISYKHWLKVARYYLTSYIKGYVDPDQLVALGDTLLNVDVDFIRAEQKEIHKRLCKTIKAINALDDFGSIGESSPNMKHH